MGRPKRWALAGALLGWILLPSASPADEVAQDTDSDPVVWLASVRPDPSLQRVLDETVAAQRQKDPALEAQTLRLALLHLPLVGEPGLAQWEGQSPVYPASVVKFVYLMAAYAWRDAGRLEIDAAFDRELHSMIYVSSNQATQHVVAKLTDTHPGPRLDAEEYARFREKRHAVKRWLQRLGITDLHAVHPTYNGGGDLYGRELQFLEDASVPGSLPGQNGDYRNRQAMTAVGTAKLLALLATDRALSPQSSAEVRRRMQRDPRRQPYLRHRIAGGAEGLPGVEVYSKTGTWGPIHADAGIVRFPSGEQLVVVAFLEGSPRYRGSFIARLTKAALTSLQGDR